MSPDLTAILPLILLGLVALVVGVWLLARLGRRAKVVEDDGAAPLVRDVLAEGAGPAPRNQALIDAAPAAAGPDRVAAAAPPAETPLAPPAAGDDLTRIKGLGPKLAALLGELGVTSLAQIAAWDAAEIARIDAMLGRFQGRIVSDQWVEQARLLSAGDHAAFAAQFGKNG